MGEAVMLNSRCCNNFGVVCSNNCENRGGVAIFSNKSAIFGPSVVSYPSLKLRCDAVKPPSSGSEFFGVKVAPMSVLGGATGGGGASNAKMSIGIRKAQKWWEKGLQPNMKEVTGAQDLVDSLSSAGDKLVVVDFFSPGCGGCKALHPKLCQLSELNPAVQFLQVNYEEHKSMCYSLNVHVLPFFRFYRGDKGRVCSFSCTNATIKKFKDALTKYRPDHTGMGPAKGLEEKELLALATNKDLSFTYSPEREEKAVPVPAEEEEPSREAAPAPALPPLPLPRPLPSSAANQESQGKSLVNAGR